MMGLRSNWLVSAFARLFDPSPTFCLGHALDEAPCTGVCQWACQYFCAHGRWLHVGLSTGAATTFLSIT